MLALDYHLPFQTMVEKVRESNGASVPPNPYVLGIKIPTIRRIKIPNPMALSKTVKGSNQADGGNNKKPLVRFTSKSGSGSFGDTSRSSSGSFGDKVGFVFSNVIGRKNSMDGTETDTSKSSSGSFGDKVGYMFSNVIGRKNSMDGTETDEMEKLKFVIVDNAGGKIDENLEAELAEEMEKVKVMIENIDMGSEKTIVDIDEEQNLNNGVQVMAEKVKPIVLGRPIKSPRTVHSKNISKRIDMQLNRMDVPDADSHVGRTKGSVFKKAMSRRTVRSSLSMNSVASEQELELCKKKILMGMRCRPLSLSGKLQYDANGLLIPEIIR